MSRHKSVFIFGVGLSLGVVITLVAVKWGEVGGAAAEKSHSKVVLENDLVRVKEAVFAPGDKNPGMHTHEYAHVGVVIDGGTLKFNYADGKSETLDLKRGGAGFREANVTHEAVNLGRQPVRVIEVEIKK
jgi:mannose-6-phosphate isomerase-like protein (cupin superfamily)